MDNGDDIRARVWLAGRSARWLLIWAGWTAAGLFFASQIYFYLRTTQTPISWSRAILWQLSCAYLFVLGTPLILWLSRRFRIERQSWRRTLPVHVLMGLLISLAWANGHATLDALFSPRPTQITPLFLYRATISLLDKELAIYWLTVLASHVLDYYKRYREEELRNSQLQTQLAQAQLQALKMQLHPHFLFNTLHSISALLHKDPDAADRMLARLGDFLRLTLDNAGAQTVSVREEIEFLNGYLEIERIRFRDRLTTSVDIDPQALDAQVPNLILQPIVENAIRHGLAPCRTLGRIEILVERDDPFLRLRVRDNGCGLPANHNVNQIFKSGVGLANTQARLAQLYGERYRLFVENHPHGGLVVTMEIPSQIVGFSPLQTENSQWANGEIVSTTN